MKSVRFLGLLLAVAVMFSSVPLCLAVYGSGTPTLGDANGDDSVDMKDVLMIRKYIAKMVFDIDTSAADVDDDGDVTMKDVLMIRKHIANIEPLPTREVSDVSEDTTTTAEVSEATTTTTAADVTTTTAEATTTTAAEPTTTTTEETTTTTAAEPTTTTTEETTTTTAAEPTTTTTEATTTTQAADDTVIFDEDVEASLSLNAGALYVNQAITDALAAETRAHGIAEQYIVTVTASSSPADDIYAILIGTRGVAAWPYDGYDHQYHVDSGDITFGSIPGSTFRQVEDVPAQLSFYAESGSAELQITHVKIEVVRAEETTTTTGDGTTTTTTTTTTTAGPTTTTKPTLPPMPLE